MSFQLLKYKLYNLKEEPKEVFNLRLPKDSKVIRASGYYDTIFLWVLTPAQFNPKDDVLHRFAILKPKTSAPEGAIHLDLVEMFIEDNIATFHIIQLPDEVTTS